MPLYVLPPLFTLVILNYRLDLARQLMEPIVPEPKAESDELAWGIPLPKDFNATSVSLLAEPSRFTSKRRAVVFVSSTNDETNDIEYVTLQLEVTPNETTPQHPVESYAERKPYRLLAHIISKGTIKNGPRVVGPVTGIFLASASFRFDLIAEKG